MPTKDELIAYNRSVPQIAEIIGADWLIYQDLPDLYQSVHHNNPLITQFEDSVFTGNYITGNVNQEYLDKLDTERNDSAKTALKQQRNR